MQLVDNHYVIKIKGIKVTENELHPEKLMILNPDDEGFDIEGIDTKEPVFDLKARWIDQDKKIEAEEKHYTVIDPITLLVTHLTEIIKEYSSEIFGLQRLREKIYTSAQMDTKWTPEIEADFADWRKDNTPAEYAHLDWDEETDTDKMQADEETLL